LALLLNFLGIGHLTDRIMATTSRYVKAPGDRAMANSTTRSEAWIARRFGPNPDRFVELQ
jgi:hypothetical protein